MKIKNLSLINMAGLADLNIDFAPIKDITTNITVFIGNNGSGKSSILTAIATNLSWFIARLRNEKANGSPILEEIISIGQVSALSTLSIFLETYNNSHDTNNKNKLYTWSLAKTKTGRKGKFQSNFNELRELTELFRLNLTENEHFNLPLIAFYPVERSVMNTQLISKDKIQSDQIDGYPKTLLTGVDFQSFFVWFREREDIENELSKSNVNNFLLNNADEFFRLNKKVKNLSKKEPSNITELKMEIAEMKYAFEFIKHLSDAHKTEDKQLSAVRKAIYQFMPEISDIKIHRIPHLHMSVTKNELQLDVRQLSQGERSLMALVGDIARRLATLNPKNDDPLLGYGIVLIDEIDMHMHPTWQRTIIERLASTFPNCQFILSTHSPIVISDFKDILVYSLEKGNILQQPSLYGEDVNTVLLSTMDTHHRNKHISEKFNHLRDLIQDKQFGPAKELLSELENVLTPDNLELNKSKLLFRKKVLRSEKN
ncbi:AAA family ATPase [Thorsellia anophelis]|uniref:Predicted ATP-binding protein involved in virulence n=1 Tax=Thorsellia anophelis DSM 18579 TaxID=1123402 RepID=A0A1I0BD95_9GAMM|nr:AAA family ATPase [Thorsellia anophelis]SET04127.1 Predicted ATP-binding protein involved in virulence [Thorsellia anophelis DSM 18579]